MENFNLKKFLVENKLTSNSRILSEGIFGDTAFADKRDPPSYAQAQGKEPGSEPDVKGEHEFVKELENWLTSPMEADIDLILKYKKVMPQLKQDYPQVFNPAKPNGPLVYRGLAGINEGLQSQIENSSPQDYIPTKDGRFLLKAPIKYKSRDPLQSFTYDAKTALKFGGSTAMLITKQDDGFCMNATNWNPLEQELLHLGRKHEHPTYLLVSGYEYGIAVDLDYNEDDESTFPPNRIELSTAIQQVVK